MNRPLRILLIEDSEDDALFLLRELRRGGYEPVHRRVESPTAMKEALERETWDLITADHSMPGFSCVAALKLMQEMRLDIPFIIVSGTIGEEAAVAAMKAGAQDYLVKGRLARLVPAVDWELREAAQRREQEKSERALLAQQEQLRIAREIQQGLLPSVDLKTGAFDIAGISFPTEATGGDYFDYFPMPPDHLGIVIGDITGHGLGASLLMAEMRVCLRALALDCANVSEILSRANRLTKEDFGRERFLTVLFAQLCPRTRSLVYLNAGHPAGYVMDKHGSVRAELKSTCLPLGLHPMAEFPAATPVPIGPGDLVLLLTDGVLDALPGADANSQAAFALDVVRAHRDQPASKIVETLCCTARDSVAQQSQLDDITAVVLRVKPDSQNL